MNVVEVQSRDIYLLVEFSLKQVEFILDFIDHSTVEYDSTQEPEMVEADKYVREDLFEPLNKLAEELKDGSGSNSPGS